MPVFFEARVGGSTQPGAESHAFPLRLEDEAVAVRVGITN